MANFRREVVGYKKLDLQPIQPEGLLAVARAGGELEAKVANFMFRLADQAGAIADRQAEAAGARAGREAALAGRPGRMQVAAGADAPDMAGGTAVPSRPSPAHRQMNLSGNRQKFIDTLMPAAIEASRRTGVDPRIIVAQAAQETGWGRKAPGNNYFGIKSHGQGGGQTFTTHEVINGKRVKIRDSFRTFASPEDSVAGYADFIMRNKRYTGFRSAQGMDAQLAALQASGYATDPNYSSAVGAIARSIAFAPGRTPAAAPAAAAAPGQTPRASAAPTPEQIAPPAVVTRLPGEGGTFRPSNRDTIYGRAYDAAGTRTFLQFLDSEIRSTTAQAFRLHEDDPAQLSVTLETLKKAQLRDDVPDEIRAEYEVAFDAQAQRYLFQAHANADRVQKQANLDAFQIRSSELLTDRERMLEAFDPELPGVENAIAEAQVAIDDHYDTAVANGLMTWSQAEIAKRKDRSETAIAFYLRQAEALEPDEIAAMRDRMQADFISGALTGIDAPGWNKLKNGLEQAEGARRREDATVRTAVETEGSRLADRALSGFDVPMEEFNRFVIDAGKTGDDALVAAALAKIEAAEIMRDQPLAEAAQHVARMRADLPKDASDAAIAAVVYAEQRLQQLAELAVKDPAGYEIQRGRLTLEPIALDSPETMDASLATRRDQMRAVGERFGRDVPIFRPGEVAALNRAIMESPDAFPAFASSVAAVFGADAGKVLGELSEEMPTLAHAAGITAATGNDAMAVEIARAIAAKREGTFTVKMPDQGKFAAAAGSILAGALSGQDRTRAATLATAQLLFEADANRIGFDPGQIDKPDTPAAMAWQRALNRSLGAQFAGGRQTGGIGAVNGRAIVAPTGMEPTLPQRIIETLTDDDLAALPGIRTANDVPIPLASLRRAKLVTVGDGVYRVALNDPDGWAPHYVMGEDGDFWTIDMRALERARHEGRSSMSIFDWRISDMFR